MERFVHHRGTAVHAGGGLSLTPGLASRRRDGARRSDADAAPRSEPSTAFSSTRDAQAEATLARVDSGARRTAPSGHIFCPVLDGGMKQIGAAKFKQECLAILDRLTPEGIVITKHGRAIARLVPADTDSAALIGSLRGKLAIKGDILSTGTRWDAQS